MATLLLSWRLTAPSDMPITSYRIQATARWAMIGNSTAGAYSVRASGETP